MPRGDAWCVEDENGVTDGSRFDTVVAAAEAAMALVRHVGSGVVYVQHAESPRFQAYKVDPA